MTEENHKDLEKNHVDEALGDTDLEEQKESLIETVIENKAEKYLIYGVNDSPPIHITVICALQQALLSLSGQLIVSLLVAEVVCASENNLFKAKLLSSTLFMSGITTVAMNLFGIRLPLFQGASSSYIIPLLLVAGADGNFCTSELAENSFFNGTDNATTRGFPMEKILYNVRAMQGSLMIAGVIHTLIGATGLVGVLLRFVGPLTIVPTLVLIFIFIVKPVLKFVEVNWGIAMSTVVVAVILFLYLGKYDMPVPVWTPSGGYRIVRYPLHQVFAILISIMVNWLICGILTRFNVIPNDPDHPSFKARTDARIDVLHNNPWITFPYPGQFGGFGFSTAAFLSFIIATFMSVLDSIGDYYACAKVCRVPAPPKHAVNRGILIEGVCSFLSGAVGCGHATSTYGGNIGAIGVTKVASRWVFVGTGIFYILFGVFGKFSALFITLPYPVLGGAIVVMFGIFFGVVLSNLEVTNMSSPRNMAIIGLSIFIGLSVPTWAQKVENPISTGHQQFDKIMSMLLRNPNLVGSILACFLDNTVPGSAKDRGIETWQVTEEDEATEVDKTRYNEGYEVYNPLLPEAVLNAKLMRLIPFLPYRRPRTTQALLSLSGQLIVSLLVAEVVCASENNLFKAKLLSSTLFMSGITTVAMNLFGIRLPLFQGASSSYIIPLLLVAGADGNFCTSELAENSFFNGTDNATTRGFPMEKILYNVRAMQGSLMIAGVIHTLIGATGLVGVLLKFVGPLTIVPTLVLIFIFIVKPVLKFVEVNWGIAMSTVVVAVILFLYLGKYDMPVPVWTPSGGYRIVRYPLHQVFAILISIMVNWLICGILTRFNVIPNDPDHPSFKARTDARIDVLHNNPWITFPYPGQFGGFGFSTAAFLSFIIATFMSVLDSIGDYYACAKVCRVPAPPKHAVNRGILIEGVCSFLSGAVGCGHATSTYGGNIGAIGVTKVASRWVFVGTGIFYILFGVFGKFSALFITLPYPVLGGAIVVMFGIFFGVVLSNLEVTNMSSPRNMAIIGLSIFIGLSVPTWAQKVENPISTGHQQFDKIMSMLLRNPNLVGSILACFLDNTVPGSAKDRGIETWQVTEEDEATEVDKTRYNEGYEVYNPLLPEAVLNAKLMRFIPFLPYRRPRTTVSSKCV